MCDEGPAAAFAAFAAVTGLTVLSLAWLALLLGFAGAWTGCGVALGGGVEMPKIALMPRVLLAEGAQRLAAWVAAAECRRGVTGSVGANGYRIANAGIPGRYGRVA
jgi:hypothetical protein